jgi:putative tricarboxylic transport membrane protein
MQPHNLLVMFIGVLIGIIVGAKPGLTATMAMAVLIPVTYSMDAAPALVLLGSAYCGALYGGAISAILLNTPGTPSAAATCIDGYRWRSKGREARRACRGSVSPLTSAAPSARWPWSCWPPPLSRLALLFGPPEYS